MGINFVSLYALASAVASVSILIYLVPKMLKEVKRPKNGFSRLRVRLFIQPILGIVLIGTRIPFFVQKLHNPTMGFGSEVVGVATSTVLLFFIYNMYKSYTYKEGP